MMKLAARLTKVIVWAVCIGVFCLFCFVLYSIVHNRCDKERSNCKVLRNLDNDLLFETGSCCWLVASTACAHGTLLVRMATACSTFAAAAAVHLSVLLQSLQGSSTSSFVSAPPGERPVSWLGDETVSRTLLSVCHIIDSNAASDYTETEATIFFENFSGTKENLHRHQDCT